ncbi:MAG: hypothetical protein AAGI37_12530 [Planctomycetota bacterium]
MTAGTESSKDIINAPLALAGLSLESIHEMNNTPRELLPYHMALAWNIYCELDDHKRLELFRIQTINTLEDSLQVMSAIDLEGKPEAERQRIQSEIELTRCINTELLKRNGDNQE